MMKHYIERDVPFEIHEVNILDAEEKDLEEISRESGVGLSLDEMKMVKDHFEALGRNPTDLELEAIGQAWSEHCCYKSSKPILKDTVFDIDAPQNIYVVEEDAGVVEFDDEHAYVVALESHNHPSAIEPYGGAATGIGGIVRDVTCMGAQPLAFVDPLFFGPLDMDHDDLPSGTKHPRYLFDGVVQGISDYGNRLGIPTLSGMVYFDECYTTNCLVNVGCIGIAEKDELIRSRVKEPGDVFIMAGGKTGRDGIHGVTFASDELHEDSEEEDIQAVQLGDPITKEPLIHTSLELNRKGLLQGMKDFGGGGLSCVAGEMALDGGYGAEVELDKVPLKEEDMAPWEIWVSESQERMMYAVKEEDVEEVMHICEKWDVEATKIGKVIDEKKVKVYYEDEKIMDLDLEFQTGGPTYCRPTEKVEHTRYIEEKEPEEPADYNDILLKLLSRDNINSKEWVIRQYDHEVRANTILKPLQGVLGKQGPGDASLIKPLEDSFKGIAVTTDVIPSYTDLDPKAGAMSVLDESIRNLMAVGAEPHSFADCLNFGNPEKPERLGDFARVAEGLEAVARHLGIPFVSGNVSFYNETEQVAVKPTPSILACGLIDDVREAVTMDLKEEGNSIYLVGETKDEMGGSEYYRIVDGRSGNVPTVDVETLERSMKEMLEAHNEGLIESCHDVSLGGLGVALSEMCLAGDMGAEIDASTELREDKFLFSESNTRWLVEVKKENEKRFEEIFSIPIKKIGISAGRNLKINLNGEELLELDIEVIRKNWKESLSKKMGK
ncbi:MAG: phosphoribosylformylglycinamidine synthase subunit PurL [Candidatus Thermoplasmatota archaeon]|nr:phosphoribosylformylglycinamidine synthase subunit PurL [Candidatus Thermoplasmatota archaeon]MBS3789617.1 phosphoribosylformylglycinamidine synthase subunit PurL [Candidatus Thermoplasmatota archaeon]